MEKKTLYPIWYKRRRVVAILKTVIKSLIAPPNPPQGEGVILFPSLRERG
ncbi:MAG: hypothetical protein HQK63_08820 [Desulfamplus sp.]|nr:hypothetical protein [Desulfamplus sp.]